MYHAKALSRRLLTTVGQKTTHRHVQQLQGVLNYIRTGRWMEDHHFETQVRSYDRQGVWTAVSDQLSQSEKVLYLEFGVARGDSMRWWSRHLLRPETRLHGFDSFEGLPEEGGPWIKGQFGTGGKPPVIHDDRVHFFQG